MSKKLSAALLSKWIEKVSETNLAYYVNRQKCFDQLVALTKVESKEDQIQVPFRSFLRLNQYLTARNDKIQESDSLVLSFNKTLEELAAAVEEISSGARDELDSSFSLEVREHKEEAPKAGE